jgi:branched-chain amino acid transport system substrate-binding protein
MRRTLVSLIAGSALAITISACGTATVGSSSDSGGVGGSTVKLGVIGSLTGPASTYGIAERNGIQMAADEANSAGGVLGHKVQMTVRDDKADPSEATTQAVDLVQSQHVSALFGPIVNTAALAVTQMSDNLAVPIMGTLGATTPVVYPNGPSKPPYKWVYRVLVSSPVQVQALTQYGKTQGWKRWAIVYEDDAYGQPAVDDLKAALKSTGGSLVSSQGIAVDAIDATSQALAVKAANPDVVLVWSVQAPASKVVSALSNVGWKKPILSSNAEVSQQFYQLAGSLANGIITTGLKAQFAASAATTTFTREYTKRFQIAPMLWAYASYDAAKIYLAAVKNAGTADPDAVRRALDQTDYQGITGRVRFTPQQHDGITSSDVVVVRLDNNAAAPIQ